MVIKSISIQGLRGFGKKEEINFAIADGIKEGSGMTIFVGGNNSGKTTILEALRSFNCDASKPPAFSQGKRNTKSQGGMVHLEIRTIDGYTFRIDTDKNNGCNTVLTCLDSKDNPCSKKINIFVLQSRRYFNHEFHKLELGRGDYLKNQLNYGNSRSADLQSFNSRLFKMQKNKEEFDNLLKEILGDNLTWYIDMQDNGNYYLKITIDNHVHSSEGMGDGIWSVFTICDALYDSEQGDIICIDEPELSLHPTYQKRVLKMLKRFSKDRQIVLCTHSPYFVDISSIADGASLCRTVKGTDGDIELFCLGEKSREMLDGFLNDIQKPHTFGLEAREIFFLEDNVIITEGQDDVVMYQKAAEQLGQIINGEFFGWGSGGASNIKKIATILRDLGYKKVAAIFDGDKKEEKEEFADEFKDYRSFIISKKDIRDKGKVKEREAVNGMMTQGGVIKEDAEVEMKSLLTDINGYFAVKSQL